MGEVAKRSGRSRALSRDLDLSPAGLEAGNRRARLLFNIYPNPKVNDSNSYALALASVFADFPEAIGQQAIDVLMRRRPFLPTAAEVHKACEEIVAPIARRISRDRLIDEQIRKREELARRDAENARARSEPVTQARSSEKLKEVLTSLAAARPTPKIQRYNRIDCSPDPTDDDAAEHTELHRKLMDKMKAAGLPTDPLESGQGPPPLQQTKRGPTPSRKCG